MEDLVLQIFAGAISLFGISVLVVLLCFSIVYDMKARDKRKAYLKKLSNEERLIINDYENNKRLTLKEFFNKDNFEEEEVKNEDK